MRRRCQVLLCVAGAVAVWAAGPLPIWAAGSWGRAIEVPGLRALNQGLDSQIASVSCPSPGNCAVGGYYRDRQQNRQGFVAVEKKGVWGRAIEVPGLGPLNKGQDAQVFSVSCTSARNCAAVGYYRNHGYQGFVAVEKKGVWGRAFEVPGLGALNQGQHAQVLSVSCTTVGNCAAVGSYQDRRRDTQAFVLSERSGSWRKAIEVPGLAALNTGGNASAISVSCASVGNCGAVGTYRDQQKNTQGFAVSERNGSWRTALEMPGLGALNTGGNVGAISVSCASPGNCAAGGSYATGHGHVQGFVAVETSGRWGQAIEVPGLAALNTGEDANVFDVSCAGPGNCAAGGVYVDSSDSAQGFVAVETNGRWGRAIEVPGLGALNTEGSAGVLSVSCPSPGNCAAGGWYQFLYEDHLDITQGFVVSESNGRWGRAVEVPGLAPLNTGGNAGVVSVSCALPGNCVAGGYTGDAVGFVVGEK